MKNNLMKTSVNVWVILVYILDSHTGKNIQCRSIMALLTSVPLILI